MLVRKCPVGGMILAFLMASRSILVYSKGGEGTDVPSARYNGPRFDCCGWPANLDGKGRLSVTHGNCPG